MCVVLHLVVEFTVLTRIHHAVPPRHRLRRAAWWRGGRAERFGRATGVEANASRGEAVSKCGAAHIRKEGLACSCLKCSYIYVRCNIMLIPRYSVCEAMR